MVTSVEPVYSRKHDPGGRQDRADGVGDRERHRPSSEAEAEWRAHGPAQVELISGEEEQKTQTEVRDEADRQGDLEAEGLGSDQDPEHQLSTTAGIAAEPTLTTAAIVPATAEAAMIARNGSGETVIAPAINK